MLTAEQVLAAPVRHFRDVQSNMPCGMRRIKGIMATRMEDKVTCSKCKEKIREAAGRIVTALEASKPSVLLARVVRAETEVAFLRAVVHEALLVLESGDTERLIQTAMEVLRRATR